MTKPSFETRMTKLQKVVGSLESGDVNLDDALKLFKNGIQLTDGLQDYLTNASHTVAKVSDHDNHEVTYNRDKNGHDVDNNADPFASDKK